MTMWFIPLPDPLLKGLAEVPAAEADEGEGERLARQAGYTRGPKGEWIAETAGR
jgi:hypothetical protein